LRLLQTSLRVGNALRPGSLSRPDLLGGLLACECSVLCGARRLAPQSHDLTGSVLRRAPQATLCILDLALTVDVIECRLLYCVCLCTLCIGYRSTGLLYGIGGVPRLAKHLLAYLAAFLLRILERGRCRRCLVESARRILCCVAGLPQALGILRVAWRAEQPLGSISQLVGQPRNALFDFRDDRQYHGADATPCVCGSFLRGVYTVTVVVQRRRRLLRHHKA